MCSAHLHTSFEGAHFSSENSLSSGDITCYGQERFGIDNQIAARCAALALGARNRPLSERSEFYCFLFRDFSSLKSDNVSNKYGSNLFGFEFFKLKIQRLKLWKPLVSLYRRASVPRAYVIILKFAALNLEGIRIQRSRTTNGETSLKFEKLPRAADDRTYSG